MILLLRFYNESAPYSVERILAEYFLKRFGDVKNLNIYDVSEECDVSRATVRRFFIKLGYRNFLEFKNDFTVPYDISLFKKETQRISYLTEHTEEIEKIVTFYKNNTENILGNIRMLACSMANSENIYWFTGSSSLKMIEDMQMQFLYFGCFWDIIVNTQNETAKKIAPGDTAIVLSISGVLADSLAEELSNLEHPFFLITMNKNYKNPFYKKILYLCNEDLYQTPHEISEEAEKKVVIYRKYSTNLFFDFLYYEFSRINVK